MIQLTSAQRNLISRLDVNISTGLSTSEANARRRRRSRSSSSSSSSSNIVQPPINCPKWICCLLPCISKTSSMVLFAAVTPDDAEVLRNTHWVRYDAASLVVGDVIRLDEHDVVPADCVVIVAGYGYFFHHDKKLLVCCSAEEEEAAEKIQENDDEEKLIRQSSNSNKDDDNNNNHDEEGAGLLLTVDARLITGESNMTTHYYSPSSSTSSSPTTTTNQLQTLLYGSRIVNGSCIAIVTAIGNNVVLSKLITTKRWPPKYDMSHEIYDISNMEINNL